MISRKLTGAQPLARESLASNEESVSSCAAFQQPADCRFSIIEIVSVDSEHRARPLLESFLRLRLHCREENYRESDFADFASRPKVSRDSKDLKGENFRPTSR